MHFLGLNGMPRRTAVYDGNMGWNEANFIATIGALILGVGIAIYFGVMVYTYFKGEKTSRDEWGARTLEWTVSTTPPPEHNFDVIPTVHARDAFWYEKTHAVEIAKEKASNALAEESHGGIHMPSQSWFPIVAALGILIGALFFVNHIMLGAIAGGAIMFLGVYLWAAEGPGGYHIHLDSKKINKH
jgi:cytochrome c oxidase subunit 1